MSDKVVYEWKTRDGIDRQLITDGTIYWVKPYDGDYYEADYVMSELARVAERNEELEEQVAFNKAAYEAQLAATKELEAYNEATIGPQADALRKANQHIAELEAVAEVLKDIYNHYDEENEFLHGDWLRARDVLKKATKLK